MSSTAVQAADTRPSWQQFLFPRTITKWTMIVGVASLISQVGIIVTGGAVRLTGSGLGCSEWPRCTRDSYVTTPEMGIHGIIEFGNRLLTFVLGIIAVLMIFAVWKIRRTHRSLFVLAWGLFGGIPAQAVIGGITVWTGLNPWVVMLHFIVSSVMVCFATAQFLRIWLERQRQLGISGDGLLADPKATGVTKALSWVIFIAGWAIVVMGTIVTGSGPHGGDPDAPRHDYDQQLMTRLHVIPVYVIVICAVVLAIVVFRQNAAASRMRRATGYLLAAIVFQGAIGYYQHFNGLPVVAVILHMLGSGLVVVTITLVWERQTSKYVAHETAAERVEAA